LASRQSTNLPLNQIKPSRSDIDIYNFLSGHMKITYCKTGEEITVNLFL